MCQGNAAGCMSSCPLPLPLSLGYGSSMDQIPILAPLPLPPPPPPPPLPPPSTTVLLPFIPRKKATLAALQNTKENQDTVLAVTLRDIQSVTLKKVTTVNTRIAHESSKHAPLITVGDLQKVCLRRSRDLPLKRQISSTPAKTPLRLRSQLKRVQICRTPGGTPLFDKENIETGLSPIMTQALRRKFQRALPSRLSPKSNIINESFDGENVFVQNV
ncbi:proline-rich protein 11 [Aplochiton taeniatus]